MHLEVGSEAALDAFDRVAIVSSFSPTRKVTRSLAQLTQELADAGFATIVVRVSDDHAPSDWPGEVPPNTIVLRRENRRYDFGSWASAMELYPEICGLQTVLLVNDSLAGPFSSLKPVLDAATSSSADIWAAASSEQFTPHLQSFFVAYRNGVLAEPPLRRFWRKLPDLVEKHEIIERYELGLSRLFWAEGYSTTAFIASQHMSSRFANPMIEGWRAVLDSGFPFVKRQLLREPRLAHDGDDIPATVKLLYGQNPYDWVAESDQPGAG